MRTPTAAFPRNQSMTTRHHRCCVRLLFAGLLVCAAAGVQASSTSLTINATIVEVQCTSEQRARIRACAPAQEKYTLEPVKWVAGQPIGAAGKDLSLQQFEIQHDSQRRVLIRTVLY